MADLVPPTAWPRCERCGGQMHRGVDDERTCMWCGEVRYPAATRRPGSAAEAYGVALDRRQSGSR